MNKINKQAKLNFSTEAQLYEAQQGFTIQGKAAQSEPSVASQSSVEAFANPF